MNVLTLPRFLPPRRHHTEALIDDTIDLRVNLPDTVSHEQIKRRYAPRRKKQ